MNTVQARDQIGRLMDETAHISNRPSWFPLLQASLVVGAALLVAYLTR